VDILGLPHAMFVSTANMTDRTGGLCMLCANSSNLSKLEKLMADAGYAGKKFADGVKLLTGADVEIVKRNELHTFIVLPKRWIVERSFAWLDKCRRLWKNCERKLSTYLNLVNLAFISLLLRRY
jgi:transposase